MPKIEDVVTSSLHGKPLQAEIIDEVEKEAKRMETYERVQATAGKLSGADALKSALEDERKEKRRVEGEKKDTEEALRKSESGRVYDEIRNVEKTILSKIESGAPAKSISSDFGNIIDLLKLAGFGGDEVEKMTKMKKFVDTFAPQKSLAEQIKELKEVGSAIGLGEKKDDGEREPASIRLEIEKLRTDTQLRIEQMADERAQRHDEFMLSLKKWDEERELKRYEIDSKLKITAERNQMMGDFGRKVVNAFSRAAESGSESEGVTAPAPKSKKTPEIEANEGEAGEVNCVNCGSTVPIGRSATRVMCPKCQSVYPIKRNPVAGGPPSETPREKLPSGTQGQSLGEVSGEGEEE